MKISHPVALALAAAAPLAAAAEPSQLQALLTSRTQELYDAVALGVRAPWQRYYADDCLYSDEKGQKMDKAGLVASIVPLPPGFSGQIKVVEVDFRNFGDTAILSYALDETESVFGQLQKARYHEIDTWRRQAGDWRIESAQVMRFYADPPASPYPPTHPEDYIGSYRLGPGKTLAVSVSSGRVILTRSNRQQVPLLLESGDLFFAAGVEGRFLFRRAADGRVDALIQRRNNEDMVWLRQPSPGR